MNTESRIDDVIVVILWFQYIIDYLLPARFQYFRSSNQNTMISNPFVIGNDYIGVYVGT